MYNLLKKDFGNGQVQFIYYKNFIDVKTDNNDEFPYERFDILDLDDIDDKKIFDDLEKIKEKNRLHSQFNNDKRAKSVIYDLARSNSWEWFVTFTFSSNLVDRTDYNLLKSKLSKWLNNISVRYCDGNLKYLVVPEQHEKIEQNGLRAWHFHALLSCCGGLKFVASGIFQKGYEVFNLPQFKLGFTTATKIKDTHRVSHYITKYVTKSVCMHLAGLRRYLASNNLNRPVVQRLIIENENEFDTIMNNYNVVWSCDKDYKVLNYENTMKIREVLQ